MPSEPAESGYCGKIKLKSYPLIERGGILWTYMGPPEEQPPEPEFELEHDPLFKAAKGNKYNLQDFQVKFEVVESEGGLLSGARRNAENGNYYWRITQWVMLCFTAIPPRGDHPIHGHF